MNSFINNSLPLIAVNNAEQRNRNGFDSRERASQDVGLHMRLCSVNDALTGRRFLWNSHTETVRIGDRAMHGPQMRLFIRPEGERLRLIVYPVLANTTFTLKTLGGREEQAVTGADGSCYFSDFPDEWFTLMASDESRRDVPLSRLKAEAPSKYYAKEIRWLMHRNRHLRLPSSPEVLRMPAVLAERIRARYAALLRDHREEELYAVQDALSRP